MRLRYRGSGQGSASERVVDLAGLWTSLRREVEDRPAPLEVLVRVRREWLDMFGRICAANLTGPLPTATEEWTQVRLRFAAEVIECYQSNARLAAR